MTVEHRFDLTEFDPVAARLDLIVAPAEEVEHSVAVVPHEISCAVSNVASTVVERIDDQAPSRTLVVAPVSTHHRRTLDEQLTDFARFRASAFVRDPEHLVLPSGDSDRNRLRSRLGSGGTSYQVHTFVSVGPYRSKNRT